MSDFAKPPQVSVVMAIKNSERFLREAMDSIVAQSFDDYEVIVIDGGSTDKGPEIARSYPRTFCIPQNGTGYAHAWNRGIAATRGAYVAFLDSDDVWMPGKIEAQLKVFTTNAGIEYVFGRVAFFLSPGASLPSAFKPEVLEGSHRIPTPGTAMVRRDVLNRIGPLDETLAIASDIPWIAKLRDTCVNHCVDEVVLRKRLHAGNLGHTTSLQLFHAELLQVLRDRARTQRLANGRELETRARRNGLEEAR